MWVIGRNDPEEIMPEVLTDDDGSVCAIICETVSYTHLTLPTNREV